MTQGPASEERAQGGFEGRIPPIEPLLTELIVTLSLTAHAYLSDEGDRAPDLAAAEMAIDVAGAAFERVRERLAAEQRLAVAQMLAETRMTFVRKRDA